MWSPLPYSVKTAITVASFKLNGIYIYLSSTWHDYFVMAPVSISQCLAISCALCLVQSLLLHGKYNSKKLNHNGMPMEFKGKMKKGDVKTVKLDGGALSLQWMDKRPVTTLSKIHR